MGFGSLFIGYAFLINITYFGYTDLLSALVIMLGLYKLSEINKNFKISFIMTALFAIVGAAELFIYLYEMLFPAFNDEAFLLYVTPARYISIGIMSSFIMLGISDVANEVGLSELRKKAARKVPFCYAVFALSALIDLPFVGNVFDTKVLVIIAAVLLIAIVVLVCLNLFTIYSAYMRICMPEDLKEKPERKKGGIGQKFREHEEMRSREYAEYKLNKMKSKKRKK